MDSKSIQTAAQPFRSSLMLSFPAWALGSNQTTSFLLALVLLTKFFHPFPHPRGSTTSTEDSPFSDTPEDDAGLSGRPPGMELSPHYSRRHWEGLPFVFSSLHLLSLPLPSQEHTPTSLTLPQTLRSQTDPSVINKSYLV